MGKKITNESVIEKCKTVHGDKYDYSNLEYVNSKTPLTIICKEHGEFRQLLCNHLKGCGCPKCGGNNRMKTEDYVSHIKSKCNNSNILFDKVKYINNHTPITLECKIHGEWNTLPTSLNKNIECPECQKIRLHDKFAKTTEEFVEKAKIVHKNKYNYSKVEYNDNKTKVCIVCPKHGDFWQLPNDHLRGQGCPKCGQNSMWNKRGRMTTDKIVKRFIEAHGDKYIYDNVNYISPRDKVEIICKKHGSFLQLPYSHLQGCGCPKCGLETLSKRFTKTTEKFITETKNVHGNLYDYSKVDYKNSATKVEIICKKHGSFWQNPMSHLKGIKCPMCYAELSVSKNEIDFQHYVKNLCVGDDVKFNVRNIIPPLELDIVNETKKVAIEYDGLYWHSDIKLKDPLYHLNKTNLCANKGYRLIHIFEDEWLNKMECVESLIEESMGKTPNVISADDCICTKISLDRYINFVNDNCIEDNCLAENAYGLLFKNELLSVIGVNSMEDKAYGIVLHCNKLHYSVINGVKKILNEFINDSHPSKIIAEIDKRFYNGSEYVDCGFSHSVNTRPQTFYTLNGKNKIKTVDASKMNDYHKIYDCGKAIFELNI